MRENNFPGDMLRQRREAKGFSIEGIRARIHVPSACLKSFESGEFKDMPEQAYALGFLRSYCRFLDLEPEPFVDEYLFASQPVQEHAPSKAKRRLAPVEKTVHTWPHWANELITWGAICAAILLCWLTYSTVIRPITESWESRVEAGSPEIEPPIHFHEDF